MTKSTTSLYIYKLDPLVTLALLEKNYYNCDISL